MDDADIWASETSSFSTPRGGKSSESRKKYIRSSIKDLSALEFAVHINRTCPEMNRPCFLLFFRTYVYFAGILQIKLPVPKEKRM